MGDSAEYAVATLARALKRLGSLRVGLVLLGTLVLCIRAESWQDLTHLWYDVSANIAVLAFIVQWLLDGSRRSCPAYWWCRLALITAMTAVTVGRAYLGWNVSGHLSCVLAVALAQTVAPGLARCARTVYWLPVAVVLWCRWFVFDQGNHWQTYWALSFGVVAALPVIVSARGVRARGKAAVLRAG